MTPALARSFAQQNGIRGIHFCEEDECRFATWDEVVAFCNSLHTGHGDASDDFEDKLLYTMMNINPDTEYAVVKQVGSAIHIECYRAVS